MAIKDDDILMNETVDDLNEFLRSCSFRNRHATRFAKVLLSKTPNIKKRLITEVAAAQNKSIQVAMVNKKSITIPNLGRFKYNYRTELGKDIQKEILKKHGYSSFSDIDNYAIRLEILNEIDVAKKDQVLGHYLDNRKPHNTNEEKTTFKRDGIK